MLRTITIVAAAGVSSQAFASDASRIAAVSPEAVRLTHVYHNAATGETIYSRPVGPRSGGPVLVWESVGPAPCPNLNGPAVIVADDPADIERFGLIHMDWGDIEPGTVISMVQFAVATDYPDADTDGDGFPDGVPGLGVRLAFFSGENGDASPSVEVGAVTLSNLPGRMNPFGIEAYQFSVDLAGVGTQEGVPLGSIDVDGDGLADFGYSIEYLHPPTDDQAPRKTYLVLGAPAGQAVPDGQGGWTIAPDPAPNAQGTTDAIDVYRRDVFGDLEFVETISGQFTCGPNPGGFYAQIALSLFAYADIGCPADLFPPPAGDGQVNFFDLSLFIQWFNAADPRADVFPTGGDGVFNFFDVSAYLALFNAGCP